MRNFCSCNIVSKQQTSRQPGQSIYFAIHIVNHRARWSLVGKPGRGEVSLKSIARVTLLRLDSFCGCAIHRAATTRCNYTERQGRGPNALKTRSQPLIPRESSELTSERVTGGRTRAAPPPSFINRATRRTYHLLEPIRDLDRVASLAHPRVLPAFQTNLSLGRYRLFPRHDSRTVNWTNDAAISWKSRDSLALWLRTNVVVSSL